MSLEAPSALRAFVDPRKYNFHADTIMGQESLSQGDTSSQGAAGSTDIPPEVSHGTSQVEVLWSPPQKPTWSSNSVPAPATYFTCAS